MRLQRLELGSALTQKARSLLEGGCITVRLTSCLTGLEMYLALMLRIGLSSLHFQTGQTGGQLYSDISPIRLDSQSSLIHSMHFKIGLEFSRISTVQCDQIRRFWLLLGVIIALAWAEMWYVS